MIQLTESDGHSAQPIKYRSDGKKHVEKNSLTEETLIQAKEEARKRSREEISSEEKREERRAANRLSAFQSRQRRKIIIEDLQKTVALISKDNANLRKEKDDMRRELESTKTENENLRFQLAAEQIRTGGNQPRPPLHAVSFSGTHPSQNQSQLLRTLLGAQLSQSDDGRNLIEDLFQQQRHQALLKNAVQASRLGIDAQITPPASSVDLIQKLYGN